MYEAINFPVEAYRLRVAPGNEQIFVQAPTWAVNTKRPFSTFKPDLNGVNDRARARVLRDICCAPLLAGESERLFRDPEIIERMENKKRAHPVAPDGAFLKEFHGKNCAYFAHLDLSQKRDSTGVAVGHKKGEGDKAVVVIDLMLERRVPDRGELRFKDTREIIYELARRGFRFKKITADGWASQETLQEFEMRGIATGLFSVDKNMVAYDTLYGLLVGGRLDYYHYAPFVSNCQSLIIIGGKRIDHLPSREKDVSDAVAAVTVACTERREGVVDFL